MKKSAAICVVLGLMSAGVANANVIWNIDMDHCGCALTGTYTAQTAYLYGAGVFSGWVNGIPGSHDLTADGVPTDLKGQLHSKLQHDTYIDLSNRVGMDETNSWWPGIPTDQSVSYAFDVPYITSLSATGGPPTTVFAATLVDDWAENCFSGNAYVDITGRHQITPAEEASGLWWTYIQIGGTWVQAPSARYPLTYDSQSNSFTTTFSWDDFAWEDDTYDLNLVLVTNGLTIAGAPNLIEEIRSAGGEGAEMYVPEPAAMVLLVLGGLPMLLLSRRRK